MSSRQLPPHLLSTVIDFNNATVYLIGGVKVIQVEIVKPNLFFAGPRKDFMGVVSLWHLAWLLNNNARLDSVYSKLYHFECVDDKLMVYLQGTRNLSGGNRRRHARGLRALLQLVLGKEIKVQYTANGYRVRAWDPEDPHYGFSYTNAHLRKGWYRAKRGADRQAI